MQAGEQAKHTLDRDNQAVLTHLHSEIQKRPSGPQGWNAHNLRLNTNPLILSLGQLVHIHIT